MADFKKIEELEKRLWSAADSLRANTGLTAQEYSRPILGLIFLKYAEYHFTPAIEQIRVLSLKNRNLKEQRDMLLPKLISGLI